MGNHEVLCANRVERKKEKTKMKIIDVALKLFGEQGVEATSMEQIAREVDIAKRTLYNYYPAKEAIIDDYIERLSRKKNSERILKLSQLPNTRSRTIFCFSELIQGVEAQKEIFEKYLVFKMKKTVSLQKETHEKSGLELLAVEIIKLGQAKSEIRTDLPVEVMVDLFVFAFIEVIKQFYAKPETTSVRHIIEQCTELFINGIKANV